MTCGFLRLLYYKSRKFRKRVSSVQLICSPCIFTPNSGFNVNLLQKTHVLSIIPEYGAIILKQNRF